jgi:hypothetical protein
MPTAIQDGQCAFYDFGVTAAAGCTDLVQLGVIHAVQMCQI